MRASLLAAALLVALLPGLGGARLGAAPVFQSPTPAHGSSAAEAAPTISVEVIDPASPIDPDSIELWVVGRDVSAETTVLPIADGYELRHVPAAPFAAGQLVTIEAKAASVGGPVSLHWSFHLHISYPVGTLIIDMTSTDVGGNRTYQGYGLAMELARRGHPVNWLIRQQKAYGGIDFSALVDDRPKVDPGPDGNVLVMDLSGGPFLLVDPDPATAFNEIWDTVLLLRQELNLDPRLRELQAPLIADFNDVFYLTYSPRIAVADLDIATVELDAAGTPYDLVEAPGDVTEYGTVAGGGLFVPGSDPGCERERRYDVLIQSHFDWDSPGSDEVAAIAELDEFLAKAGMAVFECESASIENTAHWITEPGASVIEGQALGAFFGPDPGRIGHPFLQTLGDIPIEDGAFPIWDRELNQMRPSLQNILIEPQSQDIGYVFGAVGSGKVYYMGGHERLEVSDRRLLLNALLYSVTYPKFARRYRPWAVVVDEDNLVEVEIRMVGGSASLGAVLEDAFDDSAAFLPGSLEMLVPGTSHSYDPVGNVLTIDVGDVHPRDYPSGVLGRYQVIVRPTAGGAQSLLSHTSRYGDAWGAEYALDDVGCGDVHAGPRFEVTKVADTPDVVAGQTTRVTMRLTARNNHRLSALRDVVVTDTLPTAVAFVPDSIQATRGVADWGQTALDTLTWELGNLPPHGVAMLTFEVDVSPAFPTLLLLNDGAEAEARDAEGELLQMTTDHVVGQAHDGTTVPLLDFSLTPDVSFGGVVGYELCARSLADRGIFARDAAAITLRFPEGFEDLRSLVAVADVGGDWGGSWEPASRTLHLVADGGVTLGTGESACFTFDVVTPTDPWLYEPQVFSVFEDLPFGESLPVLVVHDPGFSLPPDDSVSAEPCELLAYPVSIANTGNGGDIFNLSVTSSESRAVTLYADEDRNGALNPGDRALTDSDGDGLLDTGAVLGGETGSLLLVFDVGEPAAPVTDEVTLTASSLADPSVAQSMTLLVDTTPLVVDISPSAPAICAATSLLLDAGPGYASYDWSTGETGQTIVVAPTADATYGVAVENDHGCGAIATALVNVIPSPTPTITVTPAMICAGDSAILGAESGFSGYLWSTAETTPSIVVTPPTTTTYSVTVEGSNGCPGGAEAEVSVSPLPAADAGPNWTMCAGERTVLGSASLFGHSYLWSPAAGLDDPRSPQPNASPAATTTYEVIVTSPAGCAASSQATVTVTSTPTPVALGNELYQVRDGRDLRQRWTEPAGTVELQLYRANTKDRSDEVWLDNLMAGVEAHALVGAIDEPEPLVFYRLTAATCSPVAVP